jgi:hypothetical protein
VFIVTVNRISASGVAEAVAKAEIVDASTDRFVRQYPRRAL